MGLADELTRLQSLRDSGALSDDEFQRAKARVLAGDEPAPGMREINRLRRSRSDRWIGGVCGGGRIGAAHRGRRLDLAPAGHAAGAVRRHRPRHLPAAVDLRAQRMTRRTPA